jgi:hypothetical protein
LFPIALIGVVFLVSWWQVILGLRWLVPGDILYVFLPFNASPLAHSPQNFIVSDLALQFFPWRQVARDSWLHWRIPLWNPLALGGSPLLANDQSAPFSPFNLLDVPLRVARGMSYAMLLKLWVAGAGTALYLRRLGAGAAGATLGGLAFGTCSFMVVWLGWPHTSVAALIPWGFAAVEWYLQSRKRLALAALAAVIGVQFLGGHVETSAQFGFPLAVYALARAVVEPRALRALGGLAVAGAIGAMLAAIQLLPFLDFLRYSDAASARLSLGSQHLPAESLVSWLIPNRLGNPGVDGMPRVNPNYNESTAFVGVWALILAPVGIWRLWIAKRSAAVALAGLMLICAGVVYGPLAPGAAHLPIFAVTNNERLIVVLCFVMAVMAGLGVTALFERENASQPGDGGGHLLATAMLMTGYMIAVVLAAAWVGFLIAPGISDQLPRVGGFLGFWVAVGALSLVGALAFVLAAGRRGRFARSPAALVGLTCLAVLEAALFAGPFNPREKREDVPPRSPLVAWLQSNVPDDRLVGLPGGVLFPETATIYGLHDMDGYDPLIDPRVHMYWSRADADYDRGTPDRRTYAVLGRPGPDWLAAAGVRYVVTPTDRLVDGSASLYAAEGLTVSKLAGARSFASVAERPVRVSGPAEAVNLLAAGPLQATAVEGETPGGAAATGSVSVLARIADRVDLDVSVTTAATVLISQSYAPGWVATVDGRSTSVKPANVILQSVLVPAGRHRVTLEYQPESVRHGALLSAAGVLGLLVLIVPGKLWHRRATLDKDG